MKRERNVRVPPLRSTMTVSRHCVVASGLPLTWVTSNGLTWMWKMWSSWVCVFSIVHSSTEPS